MSVTIKYKGNTIASANTEITKTIKTSGKYCEADIIVENTPDGGDAPVINPLSITANGTYTAPAGVDGYSPVTVNVSGGSLPSIISKIDGGSFTLPNDKEVRTYSWSHNLGVVPRIVTVWCDEITTVTPYSVAVITDLQVTVYDTEYTAGNNKSALINNIYRKVDGASTYNLTNVNAGQLPNYITASTIKINGQQYYKAGATYKWAAYA